jgi:hypothetical protein
MRYVVAEGTQVNLNGVLYQEGESFESELTFEVKRLLDEGLISEDKSDTKRKAKRR